MKKKREKVEEKNNKTKAQSMREAGNLGVLHTHTSILNNRSKNIFQIVFQDLEAMKELQAFQKMQILKITMELKYNKIRNKIEWIELEKDKLVIN